MPEKSTSRRSFLGVGAALAGYALLGGRDASAVPAAPPARPAGHRGEGAAGGRWEAEVDAAVEKMLKEDDAPGAAVGVVRDGKVVYTKGYGHKRLAGAGTPGGAAAEAGPPDADTVFFIGSLSKALTAVGAMLMVEHGKLDLDAPASRYLPDLPRTWRAVTLKQFMCHSSGIPQVSHKQKADKKNIGEVYKELADSQLTFAPGSREEYNNFNFDLVGNVIETVSGLPYVEFMTRRVFKPLGMDHTGVGEIGPDNHATGYDRNETGKLKETAAEVLPLGTPSGGLESTVSDLLKLDEALRNDKLLRPRAFERMITPMEKFNATPGWFVRTAGKFTIVSKDGATGGYSSLYSFVPGHGHAVVVLRNVQGKGVSLIPLTNEIFRAACGLPTPVKEGEKGEKAQK